MKYSRCLHLVVNDAGFYLALMFPFKFHSPAVFVPWSGIEAVQEKQLFASKSFTFCFCGLWPRLTLTGPIGEFVKAAHAGAATNAA